MTSRKVPPRAVTRVDYGARARPNTAANAAPAAPPEPLAAGFSLPSLERLGGTWLSNMLTAEKNSFGVVRLLLAFAVLISHSVYLTTGQSELEPLYRWTNYTLGQHGVQVFFFLSGILVAQSLFTSRDLRDYATARALRIFPALIVCVLITALLVGPWLGSLPPAVYLKDQGVAAYIAKTMSLWTGSAQLPGLFQDNPVPRVVNSSVWTLKYEALCYLVFGLAGWLVIKMQRWRETAFALIALWLAAVFFKPTGLELHGGAKSTLEVFRYFTIFFGSGVLAYALRHYIPVHGALLLPLGYVFWAAIGTRFQEPAAAVCLGYLALWIATFRFGGLRDFTNQSDYSYATYLYHMPVAQALLHLFPQMHLVPLILITTGITVWLAFLSWELVERPALRLRHRLWTKTPASAEATVAASAKSAETAMRAAVRPSTAAPTVVSRDKSQDVAKRTASRQAEIASARASERLARELAAAQDQKPSASPARSRIVPASSAPAKEFAGRAPAAATMTPPLTTPSPASFARSARAEPAMAGNTASALAQVWRPMPSVKRLKIQPDVDQSEPAASSPAPAAPAAPAPSRSVAAMPLDLIKRAAAAVPNLRDPSLLRSGSVPTEPDLPPPPVPKSRIAFAIKRPASADVPPNEPPPSPPPAEPSRAVVAVEADDEDMVAAPPPRASQPRPTWSRPLGDGAASLRN